MSTEKSKNAAAVQVATHTAEEVAAQGSVDVILDELLNRIYPVRPVESDRDRDARKQLRAGLALLLEQATEAGSMKLGKLDQLLGDLIGNLNKRIGYVMNDLLHTEELQAYEGRWRGLWRLLPEKKGNAEVSVLSASSDEIREDLLENDLEESGLHQQLYVKGIGIANSVPVAAVISGHDFSTSATDAAVLKKLSDLAAELHAPYIANVAPTSFSADWQSFDGLSTLSATKLKDLFSEKLVPEWAQFRNYPNSRYIGLTMPRVVGRLPYNPKDKPAGEGFKEFEEKISRRSDFLFVPASYLLGHQILESFERSGYPQNVTGQTSGGFVNDLEAPHFDAIPGQESGKFATEVLLNFKQENTLSNELGFIPLLGMKNSAGAYFLSLPSTQLKLNFGKDPDGQRATENYARGTMLDNMLLVSRIAQCVLMKQRLLAGARLDGKTIENDLRKWLDNLVYPQQPLDPVLAQEMPLKGYSLTLRKDDTRPGWYRIDLTLVPIDTYQGADISLSLEGDIEKPT